MNTYNKVKRRNEIILFIWLTTPCNYWIVELLCFQRSSAYTHKAKYTDGGRHTHLLVLMWSANLQWLPIHILQQYFLHLQLRLICPWNSLSPRPQVAWLHCTPGHYSLLKASYENRVYSAPGAFWLTTSNQHILIKRRLGIMVHLCNYTRYSQKSLSNQCCSASESTVCKTADILFCKLQTIPSGKGIEHVVSFQRIIDHRMKNPGKHLRNFPYPNWHLKTAEVSTRMTNIYFGDPQSEKRQMGVWVCCERNQSTHSAIYILCKLIEL